MKEVIKTIMEITTVVGTITIIFLVLLIFTEADIVDAYFLSTMVSTALLLPMLMEMEDSRWKN